MILAVIWIVFQKRPDGQSGLQDTSQNIGNPIHVLITHKSLWLVSFAQSGAAITFGAMLTFYPSFVIDRLGISVTTAGIMMGIFSIGSIFGSMVSGPMSQYTGFRKPFVWVPGILLPVSYFVLIQSESFTLSCVLLFLAGVLAMAVPPVLATIPLDMRLHPRQVAVSLGLTRTLFPVSATLGTMFVSIVQQNTDSLLLGLAIVSPMPVTLFFCGILLPETGSRKS